MMTQFSKHRSERLEKPAGKHPIAKRLFTAAFLGSAAILADQLWVHVHRPNNYHYVNYVKESCEVTVDDRLVLDQGLLAEKGCLVCIFIDSINDSGVNARAMILKSEDSSTVIQLGQIAYNHAVRIGSDALYIMIGARRGDGPDTATITLDLPTSIQTQAEVEHVAARPGI